MEASQPKSKVHIFFIGFVLLVVAVVISYIAACVYISNQRDKAFDAVKPGDKREKVLALFESSFVVENNDSPFLRYASTTCVAPCRERLWFENRLTLDTEAWSVEFGDDQRVIEKTLWNSP